MRNVCFLEWARHKKRLGRDIFISGVVFVGLFVASAMLERVFPDFNHDYMKLPDYIKDVLGLGGWSGCLWYNIWQLVAVLYPLLHTYLIMNVLVQSIQDEERLETIVFLKNAGISKGAIMGAKVLFWIGCSLLLLMIHLLVTMLFAGLSGISVVYPMVFRYYLVVFGVSIFFVGVALNMAESARGLQRCKEMHLSLLVIPWLIAKIPDVIGMFARLLEITGRSEEIVLSVERWGERTAFLRNLSPMAWCIPKGIEVSVLVLAGYFFIGIILFLTAFLIYKKK